MATQIVVPTLGESVSEATVAQWLKKVGDSVNKDEPLVELETDKVTLEVNATAAGVLTEIAVDEGAEVEVGGVLGTIDESGKAAAAGAGGGKSSSAGASEGKATEAKQEVADAPAGQEAKSGDGPLSPAVRKLIDENDLDPADIPGTGKDGRLTKGDVLTYMEKGRGAAAAEQPAARQPDEPKAEGSAPAPSGPRAKAEREERVRMTRLRQRIAQRLKEAQNTAAMLTTYNEVDMSQLMAVRAQHKDAFEKKHGVKLGFMSFFVKAAITALQEFPAVNAEIDGTDLVYKNYYDIGVAVSTESGLLVPVVRDADTLSFADIEKAINDYGRRARDGKIAMEELTGGTFTISNGGVFGSLLSSPILNPPQSGILGMHKIQERPVAVNGEVVVRPMMYLALSYDHRIIDGREAVSFLVRVKQCIENPERILLGV